MNKGMNMEYITIIMIGIAAATYTAVLIFGGK